MCRIVAYFGPPLRLSALLREAPHSLEDQSRNAREMEGMQVAGDGWGVGWVSELPSHPPGLLKSILPLWADENAKTATGAITSRSIIGHIRLASPGSEVCFTNTPLYLLDSYLYTLNGELKPWPGELSRTLRMQLAEEDEKRVRGHTDAEMFGALWRTCLRREPEAGPARALETAARQAQELALKFGGSIRLCAMVADRSGFAAIRQGNPDSPPSLYYLEGQDRWQGGILAASEPLDTDPGWHPVEPSTLLVADRQGLRLRPLRIEH